MRFYIIIPAYNEEAHIAKTLQSLISQTHLPKRIIVVNDNSTDRTQEIIEDFSNKYDFVSGVFNNSETKHSPGSKVINAFNVGLAQLNEEYDVICKYDADLIFPKNYLESLKYLFESNENFGIVGGFCYIWNKDQWFLEDLTNKDHVRGALKAYRKNCFNDIGGLKNTMGWDTIDELLARFHGWEISTDQDLKVKHLKPTGKAYTKDAKQKQGEAFYKMRYGFILSLIATIKLSLKKKSVSFFVQSMKGYFSAKRKNSEFIASSEEGKFIRNHRWKNIKKKLF
jgi:glycosyltransferase involved in cell wall biosynthesis